MRCVHFSHLPIGLAAGSLALMMPVVASASKTPAPVRPAKPGYIQSISGQGSDIVRSTHNFPVFNTTVVNPSDPNGDFDPNNVPLGAVPAGSYNYWTATVDWSAVSGDPWSNEAFIAISPQVANNALTGVWYSSGSAINGASNGNPVQLQWSGFLNFPYAGGGNLNLWAFQTFDGSTAQWNNVTIQYSEQAAPPAPVSTQTAVGGSLSAPEAPAQIQWYKFNWDGVAPLTIDTIGSTLTGGAFPNDTELGLYSETGTLILTNDDIDFIGGNFASSITLDPSFMPAGQYWLAAGGFNMDFDGNFGVTSQSTQSGTIVVNGISIPEPASLGILGIGVLALVRRRK